MKRLSMFLIAAWLSAGSLHAVEIKKEGWLFPNPSTAEKVKMRTVDYTPRIPGKETEVKMYRRRKLRVTGGVEIGETLCTLETLHVER